MTSWQYWTFTISCGVVAVLLLLDVYLTRDLNQNTRNAVLLEELSKDGPRFHNSWQRMAARIYQAGAQDPALRAVLTREKITVKPMDKPANPISAPAPAPAAEPPATP